MFISVYINEHINTPFTNKGPWPCLATCLYMSLQYDVLQYDAIDVILWDIYVLLSLIPS